MFEEFTMYDKNTKGSHLSDHTEMNDCDNEHNAKVLVKYYENKESRGGPHGSENDIEIR